MNVAARNNPFAMQRIDRLFYRLANGDWDALLAQLAALNFRAAIVGPHGSGKTTLLDALDARLSERGWHVRRLFTNREAGRALPTDWRAVLGNVQRDQIIFADGYECLSPLARRSVRRCSRHAGGLIITAHRPTALPTLLHTATSVKLLENLIDELLEDRAYVAPTPQQLQAIYTRHRGNLRLALRELYDRAAEFAITPPLKPDDVVDPVLIHS